MGEFVYQNRFLLVSMTLYAMLGLSLYLPLMAGQLSLATPGFYAIGGYIAAILSTQQFLPATGDPNAIQSFLASIFTLTEDGQLYPVVLMLIEMVLAGLVSGVLALLIGVPALRLRGIYLALATIAFVEIVRVLSLNLDITGKAIGIFGIPQPFDNSLQYLFITIPMLLFSAFFVYRLERVRVGRAFLALREDELAAAAMGINPTFHKVLAFVMGAVLAGMVGAISAHLLNTWNARQGTFDASIQVLAIVIIGGSRTFMGPIAGGMLLTALPEMLRGLASTPGLPLWSANFLKDGRFIIYGLLIAVSTLFFPQGLLTPDIFRRDDKRKTKP